MGEKGNVAGAAEAARTVAPGGGGLVDAASATAGTIVSGGAAVAVDVADSARGKVVEQVADHALTEARERLHRGGEAGGNAGDEAADGPDPS